MSAMDPIVLPLFLLTCTHVRLPDGGAKRQVSGMVRRHGRRLGKPNTPEIAMHELGRGRRYAGLLLADVVDQCLEFTRDVLSCDQSLRGGQPIYDGTQAIVALSQRAILAR